MYCLHVCTPSRVSVPSCCTMGPYGIPWECTNMYLPSTCMYIPVCSIPMYLRDRMGIREWGILVNVLTYTICIYVHLPECLSHPAVPWDNMGFLGNVLSACMYIHHPECLSHPGVPWDSMGILGNVLTCICTCMYTVQKVCSIRLCSLGILGNVYSYGGRIH